MRQSLGCFVVVEFNQASRQPSVWNADHLCYTMDEARDLLKIAEDLKPIARGETFCIAELVEVDEEDS